MLGIRKMIGHMVWGGVCFIAGGILMPVLTGEKELHIEFRDKTAAPDSKLAENVSADTAHAAGAAEEVIKVQEPDLETEDNTARAVFSPGRDFIPEDYKGVHISGGGSREKVTEDLIRKIVDNSDLMMPEEDLEAEVEYQLRGMAQRLRYQRFADPNAPGMDDYDLDELREEIRTETLREFREDKLIKTIMREEKLTASAEELSDEAERIAEAQNSSLEMIRKFFGDDYSGLAGDVLRRKARELIYDEAVIEND